MHWRVLFADGLGKCSQLLLLLATEAGGNFNSDLYVQISFPPTADILDAAVPQTEDCSALRPGGNLDRSRTLLRRNIQRSSEGRSPKTNRNFTEPILPPSLKDIVALEVQDDM